jgi:hypothetical protein
VISSLRERYDSEDDLQAYLLRYLDWCRENSNPKYPPSIARAEACANLVDGEDPPEDRDDDDLIRPGWVEVVGHLPEVVK